MKNVALKITSAKPTKEAPDVAVNHGAHVPNPAIVTATGTNAELFAMKKRLDHKPQLDVGEHFKVGYYALLKKIAPHEPILVTEDFLYNWMEELKPSKRRTMDELFHEGILEESSCYTKSIITKLEAHNKAPGSAPRVVYDGTDASNLLMGAVTNELSKRMSKVLSLENPLNKGNTMIYTSGMARAKISSIIGSTPGKRVECDFKNNDATQPGGVRKYEAMFYKALGAPDWYVRLVAKSTKWTLFGKHGTVATVDGQRISGECPTASGNTFVNACTKLGAFELLKILKSRTFLLGDDELTIFPPGLFETVEEQIELAEAYERVASESGMATETVFPTKENATFLRQRTAFTEKGGLPVPMIGRVLERLPLRVNANQAVSNQDYFAGKLLSAGHELRFLPGIAQMCAKYSLDMSTTPDLDPFFVKQEGLNGMAISNKLLHQDPNEPMSEEDADAFMQSVYSTPWREIRDQIELVIFNLHDRVMGFIASSSSRGKMPPRYYLDNSTRDAIMAVDVPSQHKVLPDQY